MKGLLIVIIQCFLTTALLAQDFEQLPTLNGHLDQWYSEVSNQSLAPIMKGVYFFHGDEEILSPGQTPFYKKGWDQQGSVTFEGHHYPILNINYHIVKDLLLIWNWDMPIKGTPSLLVDQVKIDSFSIHNETFISNQHAKVTTNDDYGFYRKVMQGNQVSCYAKETKTGQLEGVIYKYEEKRQYYIKYKENTYDYKRKSSLYKLFPEHKKVIKAYLRANYSPVRKGEPILKNVLHHLDLMLE